MNTTHGIVERKVVKISPCILEQNNTREQRIDIARKPDHPSLSRVSFILAYVCGTGETVVEHRMSRKYPQHRNCAHPVERVKLVVETAAGLGVN